MKQKKREEWKFKTKMTQKESKKKMERETHAGKYMYTHSH